MGYREDILIKLYRILEKNSTDTRIYYRLSDKCRRSILKCFFKKLSTQKRIFCRRIKYEIRELEKEIATLEEPPNFHNDLNTSKTFTGFPLVRYDVMGLIAYCNKREHQYIEIYKNLLSQTNLGNIREMLLSHKHKVQLTLNEIKTIESKIQNGKNEDKNEEEINYN